MSEFNSVSSVSLFDSHCHLHYDYDPKTIDDVLKSAKDNGIDRFMTVGVDLKTLDAVQRVSEKYEQVYHTVGVHPHDAKDLSPEGVSILEKASHHPKCRAIGEIGLDYYYEHSDRRVQIAQLEAQLDLALKIQKPVVIHARDAEEDLLVALSAYAKKCSGVPAPGVIHCFTGTEQFGKACLDLGFLISVSGIITFKNSEPLRSAVANFPLSQMMVETDSPYLAPIPHRGKKCEPFMVRLTCERLAQIHGVTLEEAARITTTNACRVFGVA
jgi:TatD DNase family protein